MSSKFIHEMKLSHRGRFVRKVLRKARGRFFYFFGIGTLAEGLRMVLQKVLRKVFEEGFLVK